MTGRLSFNDTCWRNEALIRVKGIVARRWSVWSTVTEGNHENCQASMLWRGFLAQSVALKTDCAAIGLSGSALSLTFRIWSVRSSALVTLSTLRRPEHITLCHVFWNNGWRTLRRDKVDVSLLLIFWTIAWAAFYALTAVGYVCSCGHALSRLPWNE
jgi:hypothetical protein